MNFDGFRARAPKRVIATFSSHFQFNELCSPPLHLEIDGNVISIVFALIFLLIVVILGMISIHYACILVIIGPLIGWAAYRLLYVKPRMMRHLNGLSRIFSRCSSIDNLSLDEIGWKVAKTIWETNYKGYSSQKADHSKRVFRPNVSLY